MPSITVSFDDDQRCIKDISKSSCDNLNISSRNSSKEGGTLVNPPDKVVNNHCKSLAKKFTDNHNNNLRDYIYSCEFEKSRIKFLTIRPHDEFMFGKYNIRTRSECISIFKKVLKENIEHPFIGSIEANNNIFVHCHLMIIITNKQLENLHKKLKDFFTIQHITGKKQYAVMKARPKSPMDRMFMIRYYLGLKFNPQTKQFSTKPSYLKNIINDFPLRIYDEQLDKLNKEMFDIFLQNKNL